MEKEKKGKKGKLNQIYAGRERAEYRGAIMYFARQNWSTYKIAKELKISPKTVQKWRNRTSVIPPTRQRKSKFPEEIHKRIADLGRDKYTGLDNASTHKIKGKINAEFELKGKYEISHMTVSRTLRQRVGKVRMPLKTFVLEEKHKKERLKFANMIIHDRIKGKDIMFTDEKWFYLVPMLNSSTNKIRVCKETMDAIKEGDVEKIQMFYRAIPQFSPKVMVSSGISWNGVCELKFFIGSADTFSYIQCLDFFKDDVHRLKPLFFMQDNARPHTSKETMKYIKDNADGYGGVTLLPWPAHSPDLNPIELLWAIVQERLMQEQPKDMEELKDKLQDIWNNVSVDLCRKLIVKFDERIKQISKTGGDRYHHLFEKKKKEKLVYDPEHHWQFTARKRQYVIGEKMSFILKNRIGRKLKKRLRIHTAIYENALKKQDPLYIAKIDKKFAKKGDPLAMRLVDLEREKAKSNWESIDKEQFEIKNLVEKHERMSLFDFVKLIPADERKIVDLEVKQLMKKKKGSKETTADVSEDENEEAVDLEDDEEESKDVVEDVSEEF